MKCLYCIAKKHIYSNKTLLVNLLHFSQKTTAARNGVALSYHRVRGLYFLAVVFAATINTTVRYNYKLYSNRKKKANKTSDLKDDT